MNNEHITILFFQNMSDQALKVCQVSSAPIGPYEVQGEKRAPPLTKKEANF